MTALVITLALALLPQQILSPILQAPPASGGGSAVITLTQSAGNSGSINAGTTTLSCTLSGTVAAGDLIIVGVDWGNTTGTATATDTAGNTYTAGSTSISTVVGNLMTTVYTVNGSSHANDTISVGMTAGGTHTTRVGCYDFNSTTGWKAVGSGLLASSSTANDGGVAGTTGNAGNVTPATNQLLWSAIQTGAVTAASYSVAAGCTRGDAGGTAGNGWASNDRAEGAYNLSSGSSATTCTFNWTTSQGWSAWIGVFAPQ